jgi:hypothetical protein
LQWIRIIQQQRNFSDKYLESYPTPGDETHLAAEQLAESSEQLYNSFIREQAPEVTAYLNLAEQVKRYCKEIEDVEASYGPLLEARAEADRYQAKVDGIERGKKIDDAKKLRNLSKMDDQKETYKELLVKVVAAQKKTYAKHPAVFKAAMVAYWQSHERHVTLLTQSLENTQEFAAKHLEEMKSFDVASLNIELDSLNIGTSTAPVPHSTALPEDVDLHVDMTRGLDGKGPSSAENVVAAPLPAT